MIRRTLSLAVASVLAATLACSGTKSASTAPAKSGTPVAHIGDDTITTDEVKARLGEQAPYMRARYQDPKAKLEFLENLIKIDVLSQEAAKEGLDKSPELQAQVKRLLVQQLVKTKNEEKIEVSDDELKAYFEKHVADYVKPEKVRVQHIFIAADAGNAAARAQAKAKAAKLLAQIKTEAAKEAKDAKSKPPMPGGASMPLPLFAELARDNSEDTATKPLGGDTRFLSHDELTSRYSAEFATAVFALSADSAQSGVIDTPKGFHIARFLSRQPASAQTLDDPNFKKQLTERFLAEARSKRLEDYYQSLRKSANVSIDEAALATVEVPKAAPGAPGGFGGFGNVRPMPPVGAPPGKPLSISIPPSANH